jgi:hypothetical protein
MEQGRLVCLVTDCSVISESKFNAVSCPSFESLGSSLSDSCRGLSSYIDLSFSKIPIRALSCVYAGH